MFSHGVCTPDAGQDEEGLPPLDILSGALNAANTNVLVGNVIRRWASPIEMWQSRTIISGDVENSVGNPRILQVVVFVDTVVLLITQMHSWIHANLQLAHALPTRLVYIVL